LVVWTVVVAGCWLTASERRVQVLIVRRVWLIR